MSNQSIEELFQEGVQRYESGEAAETLTPVFEQLCKESPKSVAAQTCLSWLYLLSSKPEKAMKAAQLAVKLDPVDAQPRINLALAMLELGKTGVRQQVDLIKQILVRDPEQIDQVKVNLQEGPQRRPDWGLPQKVHYWLFESKT